MVYTKEDISNLLEAAESKKLSADFDQLKMLSAAEFKLYAKKFFGKTLYDLIYKDNLKKSLALLIANKGWPGAVAIWRFRLER